MGHVYVYGVVDSSDCPSISHAGVDGTKVRTIEHRGLAALVSPLNGGPLAAAKEVRAHWQVLDEVCERATVLPVRFGTVMDGDDAVREQLLDPSAERLEALLRELAGRIQLGVKADYDEEHLMRDVVRRSPGVAELRERLRGLPDDAGYYDRIRLGELVAAEVGHRRAEDTRLALEALEGLAVAVKEEQLRSLDCVFNLAFLVDRDGQAAFSAEVSDLGRRLGDRIALRYVGPLPPYSFADVELSAEPAWA
jgi:Gas vesicle synthesis protein GvpL/GvpF